MKKILISLSAVAVAVASIPLFAAFEAHVINVTAKIENALTVDTTPIQYGTVFPQEKLDKFVIVALSQSFRDEGRVDDIDYVIRQKPKCGHVVPGTNPVEYSDFKPTVGEDASGNFLCPEGYAQLPLLCPYLSKHEVTTDGIVQENDSKGINAFHGDVDHWGLDTTIATQVKGHLAKSQQDFDDRWDIDLKAPCFAGQCAQDWADFVHAANPDATNTDKYIQPKSREHQIFGCDLWLEVFGVSLPGLGCKTLDMMLVIDRSGSIDSTELGQLKTAGKAFVDAVSPSTAGTHVGQSSFATTGTLDLHLNDTPATIKAAIDALVSGGFTNLKEGIEKATGELDSADPHERPAIPDVMVIMTDGNPNQPPDDANARATGKAAADAAKAAGIEIFVVGIGADVDATYLKTIASGADHYFSAADFASLQAELAKLAECPK